MPCLNPDCKGSRTNFFAVKGRKRGKLIKRQRGDAIEQRYQCRDCSKQFWEKVNSKFTEPSRR